MTKVGSSSFELNVVRLVVYKAGRYTLNYTASVNHACNLIEVRRKSIDLRANDSRFRNGGTLDR